MQSIAHVLDTPIENGGGLNILVRELATGLSSRYHVYVFCPENNVPTHRAGKSLPGFHHCPWPPGFTKERVLDFLKEKILSYRIAAVFFHGGEFGGGYGTCNLQPIKALAPKIRCIYVNHQSSRLQFCRLAGIYQPNLVFFLKSALKFFVSWGHKIAWLRFVDLEINVSSFEQGQAKARYFMFQKKFTLVYHSRLPAPSPSRSFRREKEDLILNLGHLAYRKGQHVLLKAFGEIFAQHPTWKLLFVGDFENAAYRVFLETLVADRKMGNRVSFLNQTSEPETFFQKAAIYVQPSLLEAYGLALQEAMRSGCACVGSDCGGIPDSLFDSSCLFSPGDFLQLSRILDNLMKDPIRRKKAQDKAMQDDLLMNRGREQMLEQYHLILNNLLKP